MKRETAITFFRDRRQVGSLSLSSLEIRTGSEGLLKAYKQARLAGVIDLDDVDRAVQWARHEVTASLGLRAVKVMS